MPPEPAKLTPGPSRLRRYLRSDHGPKSPSLINEPSAPAPACNKAAQRTDIF